VLTTITNVIETETATLQVPDVSLYRRTRQRPNLARTERSSGNERIRRRDARVVISGLLAFTLAAILEIAGCSAFWAWLQREASSVVIARWATRCSIAIRRRSWTGSRV